MDKEADLEFGRLVTEGRIKIGLSQEATAELFDISCRTLRNIEHGSVQCGWYLFVKMCVFFNIDINIFAKKIVTDPFDYIFR